MNIEETKIEGCFLIKPKRYQDRRGYFFESFNKQAYENILGMEVDFVQDNISVSHKGVLRGLHLQKAPHAQAKLVQVIKGMAQDVVVDLRPGSPTFKKCYSVTLDEKNGYQLFIPKGCAHGFLSLSDEVVFQYKCDAYYAPAAEAGVIFNDNQLDITWQLDESEILLSEKDMDLPTLEDFING